MAENWLTLDDVALLAAGAAGSDVPLRDRLIAVTKDRHDRIEIQAPIAAAVAVEAYRERLRLWKDDVLPTTAGLEEFVRALDDSGDQLISTASYENSDRSFVLLLSGDQTKLLGAVEAATNP